MSDRSEQIKAAALLYAQVYCNERTLNRAQDIAKNAADHAVINYLELMKKRFP